MIFSHIGLSITITFIWVGGGGLGQSEEFAQDTERVQEPVPGGIQWRQCHSTENILQEYKAKCPSYFKEDEEKDKEKEEEEKKDNEKEKEEEKEERKVCKSWDFKEQLVFQRFDSFVERLKTIQDFCNTANQFLKLEKVCLVYMFEQRTTPCCQVEIGGIRGKVLTQAVQKIHETFREIYAVFGNRWKSR